MVHFIFVFIARLLSDLMFVKVQASSVVQKKEGRKKSLLNSITFQPVTNEFHLKTKLFTLTASSV